MVLDTRCCCIWACVYACLVALCGCWRESTHWDSIHPSLPESRAHGSQDLPVLAPAPGTPAQLQMRSRDELRSSSMHRYYMTDLSHSYSSGIEGKLTGVQYNEDVTWMPQTDVSYLPMPDSLSLLVGLSGCCGRNFASQAPFRFWLTWFSLMFFEVKIALNGMRKIYFTYLFWWS